MNIREITETDAEKYLKMLISLDNETENMMFEPGERKVTINDMKNRIIDSLSRGSLILVAEQDYEIVGFLSAERGFANRIKHSAYIVTGILENYRGMGIGKQLFLKLDEWAMKNGITRLELTVMKHNESAMKLYENKGFKIEGIKERSLVINGKYIDEFYMAKLF
ncbi:GNAT family N-acetyltransferase [Serpentinicella alkaliphila]|uniref:RimJ/RimL family protein N-acetyltransferase n=1 Tax=Serpentinicella alkaliphila TaxID=1734049 RepID=A0A4R2T9S3_9FIRM|nr:GNAT family N-acetyltransferase [Serpentinicella alkaliphila]QUH26098.1 GNAT family N-acetyltransferase [Serpentinicella alkaliphila]TCP98456.1 RimJ/RimL family protein N-acetyltransferase [Serpentinicella alkaliphila]